MGVVPEQRGPRIQSREWEEEYTCGDGTCSCKLGESVGKKGKQEGRDGLCRVNVWSSMFRCSGSMGEEVGARGWEAEATAPAAVSRRKSGGGKGKQRGKVGGGLCAGQGKEVEDQVQGVEWRIRKWRIKIRHTCELHTHRCLRILFLYCRRSTPAHNVPTTALTECLPDLLSSPQHIISSRPTRAPAPVLHSITSASALPQHLLTPALTLCPPCALPLAPSSAHSQ